VNLVDTTVLFALVSVGDVRHEEAANWYRDTDGPLVTTPLAVAELDHLIRRWGSQRALRSVYAQLENGGLELAWWDEALATTLEVVKRRPDVGLVDASLVALAAHRRTTRIATFDERHFRTLKPLTGEDGFTLLPADAD
jgi:predicted nucleic acid-binding protein